MTLLKKIATPVKWLVAALLIYFTIRSGKLDVGQLKILLEQPHMGLLCLGVTFVWYSLCFLRWKWLLKSQAIEISFGAAFQLGMLGQFFQTFMPGTVGADLSKALYIGRRYPNQKLKAIFSVFIDRVVGLYAILVLGALAFFVGYKHLSTLSDPLIPVIVSLGYFLVGVFVLGVIGLLFFSSLSRVANKFRPTARILPQFVQKPIRHIEKALTQYGEKPGTLVLAIVISLCSHSLGILMLYILSHTMFGPAPWGDLDFPAFVLASSLGLVAMALPISPHGLGVGQVAFASIFTALGVGNPIFGASIVTGFQLITLIANLLGFAFFVTHKNNSYGNESLQTSIQDSKT